MTQIQSSTLIQDVSIQDEVQEWLHQLTRMWWQCDQHMPDFRLTYDLTEQNQREKQLTRMVDGLIYEIKHLPLQPAERRPIQQRLRSHAVAFAKDALALEDAHLNFLESSGMVDAGQKFAQMARRFDPAISAEDIFQASRNIMTINFLQLLMNAPVEVTPSAFAYSMLYPYTDNYLDDPQVSPATKKAFNERFRRRLTGETVTPANPQEEQINRLIGMIEDQYERRQYPRVWESLLAIHAAQARSLKLVAPGASPYEADVLGITFEKGGTSVLADGYLVSGWMSPEESAFAFGYGAFTQLMDDLEDVSQDYKEGRMTIFSQTIPHWRLDGLTNRMFHFGRQVFRWVEVFTSPAAAPLKDLIGRSLDPVLIDTVGRASKFYTRPYLRELESHLPFRLQVLQKQRQKLERQKVTLGRMVETLLV